MIINGKEVKEKLLQGIDLVANTVKPTLGPQAKTVILQNNPPIIVNDGVTITKHITSNDPYIEMGIQLVQNLASKAQEGSGDGTTTACVLAQALCNKISNHANGLTSHQFYHLTEKFKEDIILALDELATEITDDDILNVATIAANNDSNLGGLIHEAIKKVGREGIVTVEESKTHVTELVLRDGMQLTEGYISHLMANRDDSTTVFSNPLIFMSNLKFKNFKDLITMLEFASQKQQPLVIFCKGMDGSALNNLLMNIINKTVECAVVLAPNFGDQQLDELVDIQSMVGGTVFREESKDDPKTFTESDFGTCDSITITKERTIIVGGNGEDQEERISYLKGMVETMEGHEKARIKSRIARLKGGVATIKVGASSSIEMLEKKERLDDALNSTRAGLAEGIIVGGGLSLMHVAKSVDAPVWLKDALKAPYETLLLNSNEEYTAPLEYPNGFNALTGTFANLEELGVFDPVKVTKNSFLAAMSIAQLFYSTEVAVLVEE